MAYIRIIDEVLVKCQSLLLIRIFLLLQLGSFQRTVCNVITFPHEYKLLWKEHPLSMPLTLLFCIAIAMWKALRTLLQHHGEDGLGRHWQLKWITSSAKQLSTSVPCMRFPGWSFTFFLKEYNASRSRLLLLFPQSSLVRLDKACSICLDRWQAWASNPHLQNTSKLGSVIPSVASTPSPPQPGAGSPEFDPIRLHTWTLVSWLVSTYHLVVSF